ncbi:MAG: hypothetical protein WBL66_17190, partial [Candidatus Acidiferrales bacterium]
PNPVDVLREVLDRHDAYALQAMIAELDRTGAFEKVLEELQSAAHMAGGAEARRLLNALETGTEELNAMMRIGPAEKTAKLV